MSLRRRLQALLVGFFVLVAAGLGLDVWLGDQRHAVAERVDGRLTPARMQLANLRDAINDQETHQRGFLVTGRGQELARYDEAVQRGQVVLAGLRRTLADDPAALLLVADVEARADEWRRVGLDFEVAARRANRQADVASLLATGTSARLGEGVRSTLAAAQSHVEQQLVQARADEEHLDQRILALRAVDAGLALALLVGAVLLLRRWVSGPIEALGSAVRAVAAGDLDHEVPSTGPPELAALGVDVERMRRRVLAENESAVRAQAALADRGMVVLTLREQLAPNPPPLPPRVRLAARLRPAEGIVAGDWYDVATPDARRVVLALADVSGHGADAGVFALRTKSLLMAALRDGRDPGGSLAWTARQLIDTGEHFFTGVVLELDAESGRLRYASAGHPSVLVSDGAEVRSLEATGPLLGPVPGHWETREILLSPTCCVLGYSDGLVEARDPIGVEYGTVRLEAALLRADASGDPGAVADAVLADVARFASGRQRDDITVVVLALRDVLIAR